MSVLFCALAGEYNYEQKRMVVGDWQQSGIFEESIFFDDIFLK